MRTKEELQIADAIGEMLPGDTLWIGDHDIYRMDNDTELYLVDNGRPLCFYQAWLAVTGND